MKYLNQQDYPDKPYRNNLNHPDSPQATAGTVAQSACGICAVCTVVDRLTLKNLTLDQGIRLSYRVGANRKIGTDMRILGPVVAERYGLNFTTTNSDARLIHCLREGGCAIANIGGNHDGYIGTFSDVGHYVVVFAYGQGKFMVLDPAYRPGKYDVEVPQRAGKVYDDGKILYCRPEVLHADTDNRDPRYYLFWRKVK
jgi:hypothetical protein